MKNIPIRRALAVAMLALLQGGAALAYDDLPRPPRPAGTPPEPRMTEKSVAANFERQTTARFTAAAGSPNNMLSPSQAKEAGWGFVSDHFKEIDTSGSGYVGLADVLRFTASRAPQRMKATAQPGG